MEEKVKKRILIITPGPKYNLSNAFEDRCFNLSKLFCGTILTSSPIKTKVRYSDFLIDCVKDPFGKSLFSTVGFIYLALRYLMAARATQKYDIVVTYDPLKTGLIGLLVAKLTGTRLVVEVNGDYTSDWNYAEIKSPFKRAFKKKAMLFVEKLVLKNADGVKLLYENQVDFFKPLAKPIVRVFPDYVNGSRFINYRENKEILFAGFPMYVKGLDLLVEAFSRISDLYPDWTLKILGYYPNASELRDLIGDKKNIFHHLPVDPDLMPHHIGHCGIFVLPSRTEAMGRVLVESMAAGKPRLGSDVGGIPTVINDKVDGLLFESENVEDLANKLGMLMSDARLREKLGLNAAQRYQSEFQPSVYFEKLANFYNSI